MKWLLVGLVTLAGCAGQVVPEPRTVRGAGGCPLPRAGSSGAELGDSLQTKVRALLAELEQRKGYEVQLHAALQACR